MPCGVAKAEISVPRRGETFDGKTVCAVAIDLHKAIERS